MSDLVQTVIGLIPLDQLQVTDLVDYLPNCRRITTEYRYKCELVKRDVAASMLAMPETATKQGILNG